MTKYAEFEDIDSVVGLKNACEKFEADECLLITAEKILQVSTEFLDLKRERNPNDNVNMAIKRVDQLRETCVDFTAWFDRELSSKPDLIVTFPHSCLFQVLKERVYERDQPDLSEASKCVLGGTHEDRKVLRDMCSKLKSKFFRQTGGYRVLDFDDDVKMETKRTKSTTGHLNRMKHTLEEESEPRKKHKNKYADPAYRSKVLPSVRRLMVKRGYTSISQLKGHYRKIAVHATQDEIDKHLSADRLQPK